MMHKTEHDKETIHETVREAYAHSAAISGDDRSFTLLQCDYPKEVLRTSMPGSMQPCTRWRCKLSI